MSRQMSRPMVRVLAAIIALAAAVLIAMAAVVAWVGVAGATGWADDYRIDVDGLVELDYAPHWNVVSGGEVCDPVRTTRFRSDCYGFVVTRGEFRVVDGTAVQGDIRPVRAELAGSVVFDPPGGWHPLAVAIVVADCLALLVGAFALLCLWRVLRATARGEPFAATSSRWLRRMGLVLVAWELAEPAYWLFFSPAALDYYSAYWGPVPAIQFGSMEPGGPSLGVIAVGLLLIVLATVFRQGTDLTDDQRMTV